MLDLCIELWKLIASRHRMQLIILSFVMILSSAAEVINVGTLLPFLSVLLSPEKLFSNNIIKSIANYMGYVDSKELLFPVTLVFVFAIIFSGLMRLILLWMQSRICFSIGAYLDLQIYKRTLYQPYSIHISRNSSEVIAGITTQTNAVVYSVLLPLLTIASSGLILISIFGILVAINYILAMGCLFGFGILYGSIIVITKKPLKLASIKAANESREIIKILQEGLGGIRDVLIDGTQSVYCKIFEGSDISLRDSQAQIHIISNAPRYFFESLGMASLALVAYLMTIFEANTINVIPVLGSLALGAQRMLPLCQQMYNSLSNMRGAQDCLEIILKLLRQSLPEHADHPLPEPLNFKNSIRLSHINFRYAECCPAVLNDVNLEIRKGSRVGLIGATGGGKSTLLDIIMGLLIPTSGSMLVDGEPISLLNSNAWQRHISHVPQNIYLADTTIAENIALGVPPDKINYMKVKRAADQACISETIEGFNNKYETYVGENGLSLSGGQRQRIGIARALYKNSDFLILDEATSSLDEYTEHCVMQKIIKSNKNMTIIVIAHRLASLKDCDEIYEIDKGIIQRKLKYVDIISEAADK